MTSQYSPPRRFYSRVDAWLRWVIVACVVASSLGAWQMAMVEAMRVAALLSLLCGAALPLWVLLATYYEFIGDTLLIRSGPFRWRVPLRDVRTVVPSRSALSGPALSLQRLQISYGPGGSRSILVSPVEEDSFVRELQARKDVAELPAVAAKPAR